jgi:sarcosine oxidase
MRSDYEYIVLGLGGIGSAAACWLARRAGGDVLGLEQFAIGHVRGASQDHSRIIRLSYHTPGYVALAQAAYATWSEIERDAGEQLLLRTGGLDFGPRGGAIAISDYADSLRAHNIPFELLDAGEIMRRWPQFHLDDAIHGMYQAASGIAPAARCNAAHIRLARAYGATLRDHAPVTTLRAVDGEIEVGVAEQTYRCRKLVVAADAWTNAVLGQFGLQLPLTITQEQVTYFATPQLDTFAPERFPIWIWMDDPSFYGFPVYGEAGVKVGQDVGGVEVTPETRTFETDVAALQRVEQFLRRYIPGALGPSIYTKSCLYTLTPDRDFVLDALPEHPNVLVALGAAHGFKFAALFGKILGELAIDGTTAHDIAQFAIDRPILQEVDPPKHFMS